MRRMCNVYQFFLSSFPKDSFCRTSGFTPFYTSFVHYGMYYAEMKRVTKPTRRLLLRQVSNVTGIFGSVLAVFQLHK